MITYPALWLLRIVSETLFDKIVGPSINKSESEELPTYYFEDICRIQLVTILRKLEHLQINLSARKRTVSRVLQAQKSMKSAKKPLSDEINDQNTNSVWWQMPIYSGDTTKAQKLLFDMGIETGTTNLPILCSDDNTFLPNAIALKSRYIFLPLHGYISCSAYRYIISKISQFSSNCP